MKYSKHDRQAIKCLSGQALNLFQVIESEEHGEFSGSSVSSLCRVLATTPQFLAFSCLSGNGEKEELSQNLGILFTTRLRNRAEQFVKKLTTAGYHERLLVVIDDSEPRQVWSWQISQIDATDWYRMVIEDCDIPNCFDVQLWTDILRKTNTLDSSISGEFSIVKDTDDISLFRLSKHMRQFPNKKLIGDISVAAKARAKHYSHQGIELSRRIPNAILLQTETPWNIKDQLYTSASIVTTGGEYTKLELPIIHPFPEERR